MWVVLFNEPDFPIATPALEALLEADGGRGFSEPGLGPVEIHRELITAEAM